ncbi:hypothetical protein MMC28_000086 [Mycoblastus sanguinarius]|nr:hypothetical protein [Mycoblastus sanguinarius]
MTLPVSAAAHRLARALSARQTPRSFARHCYAAPKPRCELLTLNRNPIPAGAIWHKSSINNGSTSQKLAPRAKVSFSTGPESSKEQDKYEGYAVFLIFFKVCLIVAILAIWEEKTPNERMKAEDCGTKLDEHP